MKLQKEIYFFTSLKVREQVDRVKEMDRDMLLNQNGALNRGRGERIPFVVTYHPAFNLIYNIVSRL